MSQSIESTLSLFGLKWNPFSADIPIEAIHISVALAHFVSRLERLVSTGGFALVTGDPGLGKSVAMRYVAACLTRQRDLIIGVLTAPHNGVSDFYRELGHLFGVSLAPRNRWGGFKALRDKWQQHCASTLFRPVLLIDEAQQMSPTVLSELRLLSSSEFDSRNLLSVVLAGDSRLTEKLASDELLALGSRIRVRLTLDAATPQELLQLLRHALDAAGAPHLLTPDLMTTLCEHSGSNPRILCGLGADLLAAAAERDLKQIDEKLYLDLFAAPSRPRPKLASSPRTR